MKRIGLKPFVLIVVITLFASITACVPATKSETEAIIGSTREKPVTQTAVPINTPTSTLTQTPTPLPTQTSMPSPTPTFTLTPTTIPTPNVLESYESPNGEWLALLEAENANSTSTHYTFRVVSSDGEHGWIVEEFGYEGHSLSGYDLRIPLHWSGNGEYMYYIHHVPGDGCGPEIYGYDLYRLNLYNGETVELIPEGHWFAIAPDDKKVAYLLKGKLVIHDLATSEEVIIELDYDPAIKFINFSDLTWSPDSDALLLLGAEDVCATGLLLDGRFFITRLDVPSYHQTIVVSDPSLRLIMNWTEPNRARIYTNDGDAWLNPNTGEIMPVDE